jgi:hypothetical protein
MGPPRAKVGKWGGKKRKDKNNNNNSCRLEARGRKPKSNLNKTNWEIVSTSHACFAL